MSLPAQYRIFQPIAIDGEFGMSRAGLYVAQTQLKDTLGRRLPFLGIFTSRPINKGDFVGLYTGTFRFTGDQEGPVHSRSQYAMFTSLHVITPPGGTKFNVKKYPMALLNEPPMSTTANCVKRVYTKGSDLGVASRKIDALGIHACRHVAADEELYLHYGSLFDRRRYEHTSDGRPRVGLPCSLLVREITESPSSHIQRMRPDAYACLG